MINVSNNVNNLKEKIWILRSRSGRSAAQLLMLLLVPTRVTVGNGDSITLTLCIFVASCRSLLLFDVFVFGIDCIKKILTQLWRSDWASLCLGDSDTVNVTRNVSKTSDFQKCFLEKFLMSHQQGNKYLTFYKSDGYLQLSLFIGLPWIYMHI